VIIDRFAGDRQLFWVYGRHNALFAPKRTPREIIGRLNAATVQALADPAVQSRLANLGSEIFPTERQTPGAMDALVKTDAEKWWPLIKRRCRQMT
jgi:tripartite-type tricarboxylate transporter receptor subunit TctC